MIILSLGRGVDEHKYVSVVLLRKMKQLSYFVHAQRILVLRLRCSKSLAGVAVAGEGAGGVRQRKGAQRGIVLGFADKVVGCDATLLGGNWSKWRDLMVGGLRGLGSVVCMREHLIHPGIARDRRLYPGVLSPGHCQFIPARKHREMSE